MSEVADALQKILVVINFKFRFEGFGILNVTLS